MYTKIPKILSLIFILIICFAANSFAQTELPSDLGTEIQALGGIGGRGRWVDCYPTNNLVVTKQEFKKLLNDEKCSLLKSFEVDFSRHTLINYSVGGDCFMRITDKIFRNDKTRTFTIEVKNYWGRCRAGGSYQSWRVIDKIPAGYKIELKEIQIDDIRERDKISFDSGATTLPKLSSIKYIETKEIDLNGCIPMYHQNHLVIKDRASYLREIRSDAQANKCKANAENLDFQNTPISA